MPENRDYASFEAAQEAKKAAEARRNDLLGIYYTKENEANLQAIRATPALSAQYDTAKSLQDEIDKVSAVAAFQSNGTVSADMTGGKIADVQDYLVDKYGLDLSSGNVYDNIMRLQRKLETQRDQAIDALSRAGYDYDRIAGYEQTLADAQAYEEETARTKQYAEDHPFWASAGTVFAAPFQVVDYAATMIGGIGHSDPRDPESYVPMNVYNMDITNYVSTVRETVSQKIAENTDWELFGKNVGSFLYETGMSVADSAFQVGTLGSGAIWLMGGAAASNQARDIIERGGTNSQAFWGGLAAGAAETLFEKFSVESLLTPRDVTGWKSWLKETMKQAGTEASEEALTEIANILSDAAIMGDSSQFATAVQNYRRSGMTETQAKQQAYLDCVGQVAWAGAGGFVSGTATGGTVNGVRGVTQNGTGILSADTSLFDRSILKNPKAARKYFLDYAQTNFPSSVINQDTGREIGLGRNGLGKFLSGKLPFEKYATGFHIPELVANGVKTHNSDNEHQQQARNIPTYDYYETPISVDGRNYIAYIRVRNTQVGDRYYGHTLGVVDDIKVEPTTQVPTSQGEVGPLVQVADSTNNSIPNSGGNVNGGQAMSNAEMLAEILARKPQGETSGGFTLTPNAQIMVDVATRNLDRQRAHAYADWVTGRGQSGNSGQAVPWYGRGPVPTANTAAQSIESRSTRPMSNVEMLAEILAREPKPETAGA